MTQVDVDADLLVDDGAGGTRQLSINDFKTGATGAATQTTLAQIHTDLVAAEAARNADDDALRTLIGDRLVASILTDPVVAASNAVRDRLPAALHADGGVKAHITNLPATQPISAADLPLPAGAATDASLTDLLSRVGPTASDTLLSLLRQVVTNTATEAAKVTHLDLTADTLNLSTDNVEGLLTTLNALVSSETTLAALKAANHTDLVALATAFATLNAKDFATQTTSAAILAKLNASLAVTGTFWQATQPVSIASTVVVDNTPATLGSGRKVVTTAGTRVALAASTPCKHVLITAETDNTGTIVVGSAAGVIAALATREGTPLAAGKSVSIDIDNLADIGLDSTVSTDGVTFIYTV